MAVAASGVAPVAVAEASVTVATAAAATPQRTHTHTDRQVTVLLGAARSSAPVAAFADQERCNGHAEAARYIPNAVEYGE